MDQNLGNNKGKQPFSNLLGDNPEENIPLNRTMKRRKARAIHMAIKERPTIEQLRKTLIAYGGRRVK